MSSCYSCALLLHCVPFMFFFHFPCCHVHSWFFHFSFNVCCICLSLSLALGMMAAAAWLHLAGQQAAGNVPWVGANSHEKVERLQQRYQSTMLLLQNFQPGGPCPPAAAPAPRFSAGVPPVSHSFFVFSHPPFFVFFHFFIFHFALKKCFRCQALSSRSLGFALHSPNLLISHLAGFIRRCMNQMCRE